MEQRLIHVTLIEQLLVHNPPQHQDRKKHTGQPQPVFFKIIGCWTKGGWSVARNTSVIQIVPLQRRKQGNNPYYTIQNGPSVFVLTSSGVFIEEKDVFL